MKIRNIPRGFVIATLLAASCTRPEMEYTVQHKELIVEESLIYVDGFLKKGTPIYRSSSDDPTAPSDRLAIPVTNGFGATLQFVFLDQSDKYGFKVIDSSCTFEYKGDKQYAFFEMEGTPGVEGAVPISFDMLDSEGNSLFGTITKTVNVWGESAVRPAPEFIPTAEKPFIFMGAELNFVNQDNPNNPAYLYAMKAVPSTSFKVSGINYNTSVNLRYNSIVISAAALAPEYSEVISGSTTQNVLTILYPTVENLAEHPEWFTLSDGTVSSEWNPRDNFMHGKNSKPIAVGMYNPDAEPIISSGNYSRPFSSVTWNLTAKSATNPLGTSFSSPGRFKIYIKYVNADAASDYIQYFPQHPGTGEHGWVPYEFEVKENPLPGFEFNQEYDAPNWQPTADSPVMPIRAELVKNDKPFTLTAGTTVGSNSNVKIRIYYATYKADGVDECPGYKFKLKAETGYSSGYLKSEVERIGGTGAFLGGGTAQKITNESVHFFGDADLNDSYFLSYVDYNINQNTIFPTAGTYIVPGYMIPNGSPTISGEIAFPTVVHVK